MRIFKNTKNMSREDWLAARRTGIGGSDAASILGMNQYSSPVTVYADKLGLNPPKEDNEAMRLGRDLEQYVAERFCEKTGKKVRRRNAILQHDTKDYLLANIDWEVVKEKAGLECKTMGLIVSWGYDLEGGEVPPQYYVQCQHYMLVTGWQKWYLAILVLGFGLYVFDVARNEEDIAALEAAEDEFWLKYVSRNACPPIDGSESCSKSLQHIHKADGSECNLNGQEAWIRQIRAMKEQKLEIEVRIAEAENQIKNMMGAAETAKMNGWKVTWKEQTTKRIDTARLREEQPELAEQYSRTTKSRVFRYKEVV